MMPRPAIAILALPLASCAARGAAPEVVVPDYPPPPVVEAPRPAQGSGAWEVEFKGRYKKFAKVNYRNGERVEMASTSGLSTLTIELGKVIYYVEYEQNGRTLHVTQTYTFKRGDVREVARGYDVSMTFDKLDGDDPTWNPDSKEPRLEIRKHDGKWEIGLVVKDTVGVQSGVQFR